MQNSLELRHQGLDLVGCDRNVVDFDGVRGVRRLACRGGGLGQEHPDRGEADAAVEQVELALEPLDFRAYSGELTFNCQDLGDVLRPLQQPQQALLLAQRALEPRLQVDELLGDILTAPLRG